MKCRHCQHEIDDQAKFCPDCGAQIIEGDADVLSAGILRVKGLLSEHRLSSARTGLEALRQRINVLVDEHGAGSPRQLERAQEELNAIYEAYRAAEAEYRAILAQARDTLKACDYDDCLALCDKARITNAEGNGCDEIESAAKKGSKQVSLLLRQAQCAITAKRWKEAESACKELLLHQPNHIEAKMLLSSCQHARVSRRLDKAILMVIILAVIVLGGGWLYKKPRLGNTASPTEQVNGADNVQSTTGHLADRPAPQKEQVNRSESYALQKDETVSPKDTILKFIKACKDEDYETAKKYLLLIPPNEFPYHIGDDIGGKIQTKTTLVDGKIQRVKYTSKYSLTDKDPIIDAKNLSKCKVIVEVVCTDLHRIDDKGRMYEVFSIPIRHSVTWELEKNGSEWLISAINASYY